MSKRKFTDAELLQIEDQIDQEGIPYSYDTKEYPVEVLVAKYNKDQIYVPTYQRNFVWDNTRKSKFIESVFLGVPIMPFLVSISGDDAELEIVDGSQRIRTIVQYVENNLKLQGLDKLTQLNGTKYEELSQNRRNKFLLRDFRFHVVTQNATSEVRADIFNRINTSSSKLTSSETRNGALQGKFYDFIKVTAQNPKFRKLCPIPIKKAERGEYEELLLRFFAYSEQYKKFKHDVAPFLDDFVKAKAKVEYEKEQLNSNFKEVLDFVEKYFEPPYFAREGRNNATPRVRFEAISVGVFLALQENHNLVPTYMTWLNSNEFKEHTTSDASNNQGKLVGRIEFVRDCLLNKVTENQLNYD